MLDATISQALVAAERIRKIIEAQEFTIIKKGKAAGAHKITISIGVSNFPDDSRDPIELVEMADSALYQAKRLGRNQVCAYRDLNENEVQKTLGEELE